MPDGIEKQESQPDIPGKRDGGKDAKHHADGAQRFPRTEKTRRENSTCDEEAKQNNGSAKCHNSFSFI